MYPNIVECFMCTNDYKCSVINDKIITQVEYLLPEITIVKRGIPLRICSNCERNLHSFSKFKDVSMENNLRLEARLREAQDSTNNMAQSCKALDFELLIDSAKIKSAAPKSRDHKFEDTPVVERIIKRALYSGSEIKAYSAPNTQLHTNRASIDNKFEDSVLIEKIKKVINSVIIENKIATVNKNTKNIEGILTNEQPCEKTMHDHEFYNYLLQNTVQEKSVIHNNINYSKDNQIAAECCPTDKPHASNIQNFKIFLPPEEKNREAQQRKKNTTHTYDSIEINLHRNSVDMMDGAISSDTSDQNDTSEISSEKFEEIYIKEELPDEIFIDSHDYENENSTKEFIIDNNVNAVQIDKEKEGFQCTICSQIFARKCALVSHMKAHNRPKYVKCNECNKYIEKKVLASHIETLCEVKKEALDFHIKSPERKDFPCPTCNKVFKLKSGLNTHIKIHTGVKDFKCHVCNKLFNQKGNMLVHLKLHNKYPQKIYS